LIGEKCIISEKSVVGGPVQNSSVADAASKTSSGSAQPSPLLADGDEGDDDDADPVKTTIGSNCFIHASSQIHAGATIKDAVLIEPHVTVLSGVTIGSHAKICAGITVDRDVEDWAVVYGNGNVKRRRKQPPSSTDAEAEHADIVETMRLKAMDKEREGTTAILKMAARVATMAKKK
jgi:acetyltransferase-like isoleucine patch superfamily enzyme